MRLAMIALSAGGILTAGAAPPTGSNITPDTPLARSEEQRDFTTKETRALVHGYAKCVVARRFAKASEGLLRNVDNRTLIREYPILIDSDCLSDQKRIRNDMRIGTVRMSFEGDLFRYALADALVSRELASVPAPDLSAVAKLDHRMPGAKPEQVSASGKKMSRRKYDAAMKDYGEAVAFSYLSFYGECVVRTAPSTARALLLTVPDSPEEKERFDALRPAFAECLSEGTSLRFGRTALRGTIAINYYRLAKAATGAPAGGTAG